MSKGASNLMWFWRPILFGLPELSLMGGRRKARHLLGVLKDRASLIKAILLTKLSPSSVHVAVLGATTHSSSSPPPDHRVSAVLSLGQQSLPAACSCVQAVMDRLHGSRDACVALKCLLTLHHIISRGSFVLKDQLSFYPSAGGANFLNLSTFRDRHHSDALRRDLSSWVRWYASVLERNLITSRTLSSYFSAQSSPRQTQKSKQIDAIISSTNSDLVRETDALVVMVEEICRVPESLHHQKNDLVYEVVRLVGDDYRLTQYQILMRLSELGGDRTAQLNSAELTQLTSCLKRLEECRERLTVMFVNRKRNHAFWDLVRETKTRLIQAKKEREGEMMLVNRRRKEEASESTRCGGRVTEPTRLPGLPYGGDRDHLSAAV